MFLSHEWTRIYTNAMRNVMVSRRRRRHPQKHAEQNSVFFCESVLSVCEKSSVWCFTQNPRNTQNAMRSKFCEILCYLCAKNLVCGVSHRIHGTHRMPCRVISVKFLCVRKLLSLVFHTETTEHTECHAE